MGNKSDRILDPGTDQHVGNALWLIVLSAIGIILVGFAFRFAGWL
jgi:hypothetical protein